MSGSVEFTTWTVLAFAACAMGICWIFSTSLWVLIPAALVGGCLGYLAERAARRYLERERSRGR